MKTPLTRRRFLRTAAVAAAGPLILPRRLFGQDAPSRKIGIGLIGMGRQAMHANLPPFLQSTDCVVHAVCDVDAWRLAKAVAAVDQHYGAPGCRGYRDFRELLARSDIDAVMISTPDHWHVPMALAAVRAGKDVALEKPITRSIDEGRLLAKAVAEKGRVFRVDSEFRSSSHFHKLAELVRNGVLGKLHAVRTGSPREVFPSESAAVAKPPTDLDYELWLGPAPQVEYMEKRVHKRRDNKSRPGWMRNLDYCDGMICNWGTHLNDIAQWGADTERTGPVEVKATGVFHNDPVWNVLESFDAHYRFENGLELSYTMGTPHVRFEGEKGWIQVEFPGQFSASDPALLKTKLGPDAIRFPLRSEKKDFIECVKSRGRTLEDEEVGQRTTSLCHLAHISIKLGGRTLSWDPVREVFPQDEEATRLTKRPPLRKPWKLEA